MHPTQTLPGHYSAILRDAHSVVDALKDCGALSGPEHLRAIEALGQRHGLPDEAAIPSGKRLVCRSAVVRGLDLAGVLELAAATFDLVISASDLDDDQREVDDACSRRRRCRMAWPPYRSPSQWFDNGNLRITAAVGR